MKAFVYTILSIILLSYSQRASSQMTARVVADNLFIPWELVYGPDGHIWFTQKNGYICRLEPVNGKVDTLYYEPNTSIQSESGMLGMALHPDFANNPYVYVAYNYQQGGMKERIIRLTYDGTKLTTPTTLIEDIEGSGIHNGCRLKIVGDKLYITTGDAADQATPQNINSVNGKVLRLNLDGTIPADNPIAGNPAWSWGHRNAQGLVYANNRLYSSEHGPSTDDEINIIEKGRNYGWPDVHGYCNTTAEMTFCNDSNVVEPIMAWTPTIAVSGIDYYNHPMFPALQNSVLMTTLKDAKLYQLQLNSSFDDVAASNVISIISGKRLRAICIDPDGRIYVSTSTSPSSGTGAKTDQIIEIYDPSYSSVGRLLKEKNQLIAVYPNPAKDEINVYANIAAGNVAYEYAIINTSGQVLAGNILKAGNNKISLSGVPSGIYWLQVSDGGAQVSSTKFNKL